MTERAYTVSEIDRMRTAVQEATFQQCLGQDGDRGMLHGSHGMYGRLILNEKGLRVSEDRLRTYMLAGVSPDELDALNSGDRTADAKTETVS